MQDLHHFPRPDTALIASARAFPAATLHEAAGKVGVLPPAIRPVAPHFSLCGPALIVQGPPRDNLWLHRAIAVAQEGDILVVYVDGYYEAGYWGENMNIAAIARKLGGLVIDGCVRDAKQLQEADFPVFARGFCIRGTAKDPHGRGSLHQPLHLDGVVIQPGDLIRGDLDGVVAIPRTTLADTLTKAQAREDKEAAMHTRLRQGETSLDIHNWPLNPPK